MLIAFEQLVYFLNKIKFIRTRSWIQKYKNKSQISQVVETA